MVLKEYNLHLLNPEKNISYNLDGSYSFKEQKIIRTMGTNLNEIFAYTMINPYKTISNDISEILELFGIEAAREYLVQEFNVLLENTIVYRHHSLLADLICFSGKFMQIARYGINKSSEYSPFAKASFEEVVDVLIKSSTFAEFDDMRGTSSNIMIGQKAPIGTNFFDILLDEEKFMENLNVNKNDDHIEHEIFNEEELEKEIMEAFEDNDGITDSDFTSDIMIPPIQTKC